MRAFDVAYFTASCDEPELNKKFAKSLELDYPILSDPKCEVAKAYGVLMPEKNLAMRHTFYIGTDGKILHIDREVTAKTHGPDVAATLEKLGVAKAKPEEE